MRLYFDGGCTPNPGMMEAALVSGDGSTCKHFPRLGWGTCNEAAWLGFIRAVKEAIALDKPVDIRGDSLLVINQAKGIWLCNSENLKPYLAEYQLLKAMARHPIRLGHVGRAQNRAGLHIKYIHKRKARLKLGCRPDGTRFCKVTRRVSL